MGRLQRFHWRSRERRQSARSRPIDLTLRLSAKGPEPVYRASRYASSARIRSMIPVNGSSFGRADGRLQRYPGGTENASVLATVRDSIPDCRTDSRRLRSSI